MCPTINRPNYLKSCHFLGTMRVLWLREVLSIRLSVASPGPGALCPKEEMVHSNSNNHLDRINLVDRVVRIVPFVNSPKAPQLALHVARH